MNVLIIVGTARTGGNTWKSVHALTRSISAYREDFNIKIVDLSALSINFFRYSKDEVPDDFIGVVKRMVDSDAIVFATPVYWYSMSTIMKAFFDRLTDILMIESYRPIKKALKGRLTYLIANGEDQEIPEGFVVPFKFTSKYLNMSYCNEVYLEFKGNYSVSENDKRIEIFCEEISGINRVEMR